LYDKTNNIPASSDLPFSAELSAHLSPLQSTDSDGICFDTGAGCEVFVSSDITGATIIYGVVFLKNEFQSELQNALVPVTLKIWAIQNNLNDFYTISSDICTTFILSDFEFLSCDNQSGAWCNTTYQSNFAAPHFWSNLTAGKGNVSINAPGENNTGKVALRLNLPSYLQFDYYGNGVTSPTATVDFGLSNKGGSLIFIEDEYK
ncbi:MAG: hypothetical protein HRU38_16140, partial [Saccharospirillaceae bacterium]|nr:hypothetical protein [Pseudomonadales bacterium]NRB80173.1 hypothetical protein [Saccharospirillaceae bacterium]